MLLVATGDLVAHLSDACSTTVLRPTLGVLPCCLLLALSLSIHPRRGEGGEGRGYNLGDAVTAP